MSNAEGVETAVAPGIEITLARALKVKNRVKERISWLKTEISRLNSVEKGLERDYEPEKLYGEYVDLQEKLCRLKADISSANTPVQAVIYRLAELKDRAVFLKGLSTKSGETRERDAFSRSDVVVITYDARMSKVEVDREMADIRKMIDASQEVLDGHNVKVTIKVDASLEGIQ